MALGRKVNARKFPDGSGPRPDNSDHKRKEAVERQEAYDKLSAQDKVDRLDRIFGVGLGAKKERARLASRGEVK